MFKVSVPVRGIVESMSYFVRICRMKYWIFGKGSGARDLAKKLGVDFLGGADRRASSKARDIGKPILAYAPGSPPATALREIAGRSPSSRCSRMARRVADASITWVS
jgi:hypothetical protein